MSEMSTTELRAILEEKLKEAKEKVTMFELSLETIDSVVSGIDLSPRASAPPATPQTDMISASPSKGEDKPSITGIISDFTLNAKGLFNSPGITQALLPQFPNMDYASLNKRVASVLWNLHKKQKKIEIMEKGIGRKPNLYAVVSETTEQQEEEVSPSGQ